MLDLEANDIRTIDDLQPLSKNKKIEEINLKDNPVSTKMSFGELSQSIKFLLPKIQLVNEQDLSVPLKKDHFKKKVPNAIKKKETAKKNLKESCKNFQDMLASHSIKSDLLAMQDSEIDNYIKSVIDDGPEQAIPEDEIDDYDL